MTYYSTGVGTHLPPKCKMVECNENTGDYLVKGGFLVTSLSELETKKETVEINAPVEEKVVEKKVAEKPKGRSKKATAKPKVKRK